MLRTGLILSFFWEHFRKCHWEVDHRDFKEGCSNSLDPNKESAPTNMNVSHCTNVMGFSGIYGGFRGDLKH